MEFVGRVLRLRRFARTSQFRFACFGRERRTFSVAVAHPMRLNTCRQRSLRQQVSPNGPLLRSILVRHIIQAELIIVNPCKLSRFSLPRINSLAGGRRPSRVHRLSSMSRMPLPATRTESLRSLVPVDRIQSRKGSPPTRSCLTESVPYFAQSLENRFNRFGASAQLRFP